MIELIYSCSVTRVDGLENFFALAFRRTRGYFSSQNELRELLDAIGTENLLRSQSAVVGHVYSARVMNISVRVIHAMTAE